jgi:uncharacterized protein
MLRRGFKLLTAALLISAASSPSFGQQNPDGLARPDTSAVADALLPLSPGSTVFKGGLIGNRWNLSAAERLSKMDENELLDCFERRTTPHQDWAGEHVGKWLHAATLSWAENHDPALKASLDRVVARLLKTQEADGYLGSYVPEHKWTSWDVWVHKYNIIGLLTYYQYTGNAAALQACRRMGDLLVRTFGFGPGQRNINKAGEHMGMAADSVLEPIMLLYRATGDSRYLRFARYIVSNYDTPGGPAVLASLERTGSVRRVANGKAYEMTSNFNGLLELYRATGDKRLLKDMLIAWKDITTNRLYPTGSASSYEVFQEDGVFPPGNSANICETCVTVTWEQMNLQLLRLQGDAMFADEAERAIYNHLFAAQRPYGGDWVYYTPLEGRKQYDAVTTCCHSSGPRGVALLPEFAWMVSGTNGPALTAVFYNSGTVTTSIPGAGKVTVNEVTGYPFDGKVEFHIKPGAGKAAFTLRLRVPAYTAGLPVTVAVNGAKAAPVKAANGYCELKRTWGAGDTVTLSLPVQTRLMAGKGTEARRAMLMHGPVVFALDTALNPTIGILKNVCFASDAVAGLNVRPVTAAERASLGAAAKYCSVILKADVRAGLDQKLTSAYFTPYAEAGVDGKQPFTVWVARPGFSARQTGSGSLFSGALVSVSRLGNADGDISDDDPTTYRVTFNDRLERRDWYALSRSTPVTIDRVVFMHGKSFHDGGWFDTNRGKPTIEVQTELNGPWTPVTTLESYPHTTDTDSAGLKPGQKFEVSFPAIRVYAVRIGGKPSCGDNPKQNFSSCAELQAFGPSKQ